MGGTTEQSFLQDGVDSSGGAVVPSDSDGDHSQSSPAGRRIPGFRVMGLPLVVVGVCLMTIAGYAVKTRLLSNSRKAEPEPERDLQLGAAGGLTFFCYMVVVFGTAEQSLAQGQATDQLGIFRCSNVAVFSTQDCYIPGTPTTIVPTTSGTGNSVDNTAANTNIWLNVWKEIRDRQWHLMNPWTVKADPDAVFIIDRLAWYLTTQPTNPYPPPYPVDWNQGAFVPNCDKYPGWHDLWPMMWGPSEVVSKQAMVNFFNHQGECEAAIDWMHLGEDTFLGKCLRKLHTAELFLKIQDRHCGVDTGVTSSIGWPRCDDSTQYVFHPHKDYTDWLRCWTQAHGIPTR